MEGRADGGFGLGPGVGIVAVQISAGLSQAAVTRPTFRFPRVEPAAIASRRVCRS